MENHEKNLETLLTDFRIQKGWTYLNVVEELSKLGVMVTEKQVKKWEYGLEVPDLDMIYKLSELYFISSEDLIQARDASFSKSYHTSFLLLLAKWFCYLTGFTVKASSILIFLILGFGLIRCTHLLCYDVQHNPLSCYITKRIF